jgi:hypothetical protein
MRTAAQSPGRRDVEVDACLVVSSHPMSAVAISAGTAQFLGRKGLEVWADDAPRSAEMRRRPPLSEPPRRRIFTNGAVGGCLSFRCPKRSSRGTLNAPVAR